MHKRKGYYHKIKPYIGKPIIKVITGMRRIGKSTFLKLLIERLIKDGISENNIVYINKESLEFDYINTYQELYSEIKTAYKNHKSKLFVFIDEVQEIESWEKAITSILSEDLADIYITGSNAHLLSSELATLISGRYIEIPIYPLSFIEYSVFRNCEPDSLLFKEYIKFGGFPGLHHSDMTDDVVFEYISSIFDSIVLKDVVKRNNIRNIALLEKIIHFLLDNMSSVFSAKRIADFLKKEQRNIGIETVYNYVHFLEAAFIIHRVPRYDLKCKKFLEINEKYYLGETGLRHGILGFKEDNINALLENIVFLELKRRNFKVYIGKYQDREIDFILEKGNSKAYIQVCYLLASDKAVEREFSVLLEVNDNYPKYVLSMDELWNEEYKGIKRLNIIDFLKNEDLI